MSGIVEDLTIQNVSLQAEIKRLQSELDFFYSLMQTYSPRLDGQHGYRFRSGWPMTHCKGPTKRQAVANAVAEVERSEQEDDE